jgi:hypothetical protein
MDSISVMVVVITAIGCGTATVLTFMDKAFGGKTKQAQLEAKMAQERARMLELQLVESQRHGEQLAKQLEWHTKMLETQDRLMKQLTDGSREPVGTSR